MSERLSRFGVGPKIILAVLTGAVAAGLVSYAFPRASFIPSLRHPVVAAFGWALVGAGVLLWLTGAVVVMRAYNHDRLVTSGVYKIVRHPMYAAWIVLILPGLTVLSTSWPLLLAPVSGYVVFKQCIRREDEYLAKRFGRSYLDYRASVNEIVPIPRLGRR